MRLLDFFRKDKYSDNIVETRFHCQRDGLTIRGTEYKPEGINLPIAIVSHGFMAFQDTVRHYARILAQMGYVAYCFDFCGGCVARKGKSDGKTTQMSVLTEVMDLEAVIRYAKTRPYVNQEQVLLMGCSQGGFVSAITAARKENGIAGLVLFYPALCIPDDARAGKMMFAKFDPENVPDIVRCGPMTLGSCYVNDVIHMNPYDEIKDFDGPVLIVHGSEDKVVDVSYAVRAFEVYDQCSDAVETHMQDSQVIKRVDMHIIENAGHGFSKKYDEEAIEILCAFVNPYR